MMQSSQQKIPMMQWRRLYLTIISAKLHLSESAIYVKVSVSELKGQTQRTPVAKDGDQSDGTEFSWNFPMKFEIKEEILTGSDLDRVPFLDLKLKSPGRIRSRGVGLVKAPLRRFLLDNVSAYTSDEQEVEIQINDYSGHHAGILKFSYRFEPPFTNRPRMS
ncbi:hypothetical protein SLE2022_126180 [Rubroshorea leprosula]